MNSAAPMVFPRWEWRTFSPSLKDLRARLEGAIFQAPRVARETYLLCRKSSHNAKIRGNSLQLKWRKQVDSDGLELWDPILQSDFPLDAEFVLRLLGVLGLEKHGPEHSMYDLNTFFSEIVDPCADLQAVVIQKRHEGFEVQGARCKFTRITGTGKPFESFCIEHEDPEIVKQVIQELGLDSRANINYPKGLKQALGIIPTP